MQIRNCIFCDCVLRPSQLRRPDSRTAEHIFSVGFRRVSLHQTMNMYLGSIDGGTPKLMYSPTLNNLTMRGVCNECNRGWMSKLETDVEPILARLRSLIE